VRNEVALGDVAWRFVGGAFSDLDSFESSLRQYQERFGEAIGFEPGELAILAPAIRVQYMCWDGEEQTYPIVTLAAKNGVAFSVGDLLFQLHNAVVEKLENIDHHYFEGLVLVSSQAGNQPPLYTLCQGS